MKTAEVLTISCPISPISILLLWILVNHQITSVIESSRVSICLNRIIIHYQSGRWLSMIENALSLLFSLIKLTSLRWTVRVILHQSTILDHSASFRLLFLQVLQVHLSVFWVVICRRDCIQIVWCARPLQQSHRLLQLGSLAFCHIRGLHVGCVALARQCYGSAVSGEATHLPVELADVLLVDKFILLLVHHLCTTFFNDTLNPEVIGWGRIHHFLLVLSSIPWFFCIIQFSRI